MYMEFSWGGPEILTIVVVNINDIVLEESQSEASRGHVACLNDVLVTAILNDLWSLYSLSWGQLILPIVSIFMA